MQTIKRYYTNYTAEPDRSSKSLKNHTYLRKFGVVLGVISVLVITKGMLNLHPQTPKDKSAPVTSDTQQDVPPKKIVDLSALPTSIQQITSQYPYNTSVAVVDLNSGNKIQTGDDAPYVAASTTKLVTAALYLHKVEEGSASLTKNLSGKTAQTHLQLMINRSDNNSWHTLNQYLGADELEAYARAHGLESYNATTNTVTSSDIAQLLAELYKRELINDANTKLLLSWMQNTSEERFIPPGVPTGMQAYHKSGYLTDRVHDVAVIDNGSTPFVIAIFSKSYTNSYDYTVGQKLYKELTSTVIQTYNK